VAQTPRDELDALLNAVLPFAEQMLRQHGDFYPFGATIGRDGKISLVQADVGDEEEIPDSPELVHILYEGLRDQAVRGEIRGGAVCTNVAIRLHESDEETDVVRVSLDHAKHEPLDVLQPYAIERNGDVVFGVTVAVAADPRVFGGAA
jgi:predicted methyltransferase MtxX (methanogen marker protein 4)